MTTPIFKDILRASGKKQSNGLYPFTISSQAPDRVNDVIVQTGIRHDGKTIAQVNHSGDILDRIGNFINIRTVKGKSAPETQADLELLPEGVSKVADFIRKLLDLKYELGASIGFRGRGEPIKDGGYLYKNIDLLECSVVQVPCHQNAYSIARSFNLTDGVMKSLFINKVEQDSLEDLECEIILAKDRLARNTDIAKYAELSEAVIAAVAKYDEAVRIEKVNRALARARAV